MSGRTNDFRKGFIAGLPVFFGYLPVGIAFALIARQAGFNVWETCSFSLFVFAGSSQMMAAGMYAQGAGIAAIVIATFILNLRHFIMSTCVLNKMHGAPVWKKALAMFGNTDESFAVFTTAPEEKCSLAFFLGIAASTYLIWNCSTLAGALALDFLPEIVLASTGIAIYALFISLLVPKLSGNLRLTALVAMTGLCNALLCRVMAGSWALILSTLLCAFTGSFFIGTDEEKEGKGFEN